jgi:hypothetical protein
VVVAHEVRGWFDSTVTRGERKPRKYGPVDGAVSTNDLLAQLAEHPAVDREVTGSNPVQAAEDARTRVYGGGLVALPGPFRRRSTTPECLCPNCLLGVVGRESQGRAL